MVFAVTRVIVLLVIAARHEAVAILVTIFEAFQAAVFRDWYCHMVGMI